ncbi:hypothetical protein Poli38472_011741 [Pythium oligandrum]|uniref:Uncharacterized protein n=1 Tax=Pythium oligandrum TaxID=41045 RepID=A0A8K1FGW2_PYTOL|nr:hypothetical protein Poli38472_011741 [Pythium oligandrum]|eukprot:TMW58153.1 hypothetical protein Poli38472_011741 [Pythium oligandrum]
MHRLSTKPSTAPTPLRREALRNSGRNLLLQAVPSKPLLPTLTPQFHWNLNNLAVSCLSESDRRALYAVFRFYDSSSVGDELPAIHYERFLDLLRDARLLSSSDAVTDSNRTKLDIETVERVFAQSVLGKLRSYVDAEGIPALTFERFAGALMNCAMLLYPTMVSTPETAYKRLLSEVMQPFDSLLPPSPTSKGLLQHCSAGSTSTWSLAAEFTSPDHTIESTADYLAQRAFQQVLASLSLDKTRQEQYEARVQTLYDIPEELQTFFNGETIRLVTEQFKTFDVFERGVLPRSEVFVLLSRVAKKLEITDVYEVLNVIMTETLELKQATQGSVALSPANEVVQQEISLVQLLQAMYTCRRSRSAAYASANAHQRKANEARAKTPSKGRRNGDEKVTEEKEEVEPLQTEETTKKTKEDASEPATRAARDKRLTRVRGNGVGVAVTQKTAKAGKKGEKVVKKTKGPVGDASLMLRRFSKRSENGGDPSEHSARTIKDDDNTSIGSPRQPPVRIMHQDLMKSIHSSISSSSSGKAALPSTVTASKSYQNVLDQRLLDSDEDFVNNLDTSRKDTLVNAEVPSSLLRMRMFYGVPADTDPSQLDGVICFTATLRFKPRRELEETLGVYFRTNGDRIEVWDHHVHNLEDFNAEMALRRLCQRVFEMEADGFALVPDESQREVISSTLQRLREGQLPRYALSTHQTTAPITKDLPNRRKKTQVTPPVRRSELRSLERGSTFVRPRVSSDLLLFLSDSPRQQTKKRLTRIGDQLEPAVVPIDDPGPESSDPKTPMDYKRLMASWDLAGGDDWVYALNAATDARTRQERLQPRVLNASASLPILMSQSQL